MFKVNNRDTRTTLLTPLTPCFTPCSSVYCQIWTGKCWLAVSVTAFSFSHWSTENLFCTGETGTKIQTCGKEYFFHYLNRVKFCEFWLRSGPFSDNLLWKRISKFFPKIEKSWKSWCWSNIYLSKVRKMCEICSKLTTETRRQWRRFHTFF